MFDLSNLNDYEFEMLCRDIMQKKLSVELSIFARGVDQGIDICDTHTPPIILIQAKHYAGSKYNDLRTSLKKEIAKIEQHNPNGYYICTSLSLTRKNKIEIMNMFPNYIHNISHIVDKIEINNFLADEQNKDLVLKNYKLWLCASNVLSLVNNQNVFIDCSELMLDIEAQSRLFVETQAYREAFKILNDNRIVIIVGAPGVGKSTVSKMLLLRYASKKYSIRYVSSNDIMTVKNVVSLNPNKKEIVLLDDFLGQHYLSLKETLPNELKTFISFIEKNKHKKLILNSRITILNEAMQKFITLKDVMEKHESNKYLLDLDQMSFLEKAKIAYNHFYFHLLPKDYLSTIKVNKNYFKIVKHKNFNPRIIEFVTKKHNYENLSSKDYLNYICDKLNNPEEVWKDEFRNRLNANDRMLMNTLYSLSNTSIDNLELEKAFNKRIMSLANQDTSINQYKDTITRLTNSLLKNIDDRGTKKISVINPSINDYLLSELSLNSIEQIAIIDNAVYFEQIFKVIKSDEAKKHFIEKLLNQNILKLEVLQNSTFFYFVKAIIDLNVFEKRLSKTVKFALERVYTNLSYISKSDYGTLIHKIFSKTFYDFYKLHNILFSEDKMYFILEPMHLRDTIDFINTLMESYDMLDNDELVNLFKDLLIGKITDDVQSDVSSDLSDIVSTVLSVADDHEIRSYMDETSDYLDDVVWDDVQDEASKKVEEILMTINEQLGLSIYDFEINDMRCYLDISDTIKTFLNEPDSDSDDYYERSSNQTDDSIITSLFER